MIYDYIVIGAGAAGLSFAALMEKKGFKVALLEAHSLPGGCSSYFERSGNIFDAGATTLSGLLPGRSLEQLIKDLDLKLDLKEINPGLVSMINGKKIRRFKSQKEWLLELKENFPSVDHELFWNLVKNIDEDGWSVSSKLKNVPMRSLGDLFDFSLSDIFGGVRLISYLLKSVANYLPGDKNAEYKSFIDELLFITAQNHMEDTPMLMGAMGLNYPADTWYAMGGMKVFSESLASKCTGLFYRHKVLSIHPENHGEGGFRVQTTKGDFLAKKLVSSLPFWNHAELFSDKRIQTFFNNQKSNELSTQCWSAFTIYLTVPLDINRESLYYQIHCKSIPNCETYSFFASFSHPEDKKRAKEGRQVVTISTHTKPGQWMNISKEAYQNLKKETTEFILKEFCKILNIDFASLDDILTGSPETFIKYTKRSQGLVGGIPHSLRKNPIKLVQSTSPIKNFYLIGDTQFPGQGIGAVVLGAQNLVYQLNKLED